MLVLGIKCLKKEGHAIKAASTDETEAIEDNILEDEAIKGA